jgi:hypothetical protein
MAKVKPMTRPQMASRENRVWTGAVGVATTVNGGAVLVLATRFFRGRNDLITFLFLGLIDDREVRRAGEEDGFRAIINSRVSYHLSKS